MNSFQYIDFCITSVKDTIPQQKQAFGDEFSSSCNSQFRIHNKFFHCSWMQIFVRMTQWYKTKQQYKKKTFRKKFHLGYLFPTYLMLFQVENFWAMFGWVWIAMLSLGSGKPLLLPLRIPFDTNIPFSVQSMKHHKSIKI